ncbi:integrase [Mycobacterium marseillense]|uniref:integrase n=1 Tax=Mycobacterium marseillense TaxID=701042 RepID=UPI0015D21B5E|nr:integrase [Mycobacterium marseillense]
MNAARTELAEETRVLLDWGTAVVVAVSATGVTFRDAVGDEIHRGFDELTTIRAMTQDGVAALARPLRPVWDALDDKARDAALMRLEVVQEIITGFRDGHAKFARPGEPRYPFGPGFGVSESVRATEMARLLGLEGQFDRVVQRRVRDGEIRSAAYNPSTVRNWVRQWKSNGLLGLIDKRSLRESKAWDLIDKRYRDVAVEVVSTLDGDRSTVSQQELDRRIRVRLKQDGIEDLTTPQRITAEYLSTLKRQRGKTTRAQRSRALQQVSGYRHYPAIRPGQVVAIDVTRADNLVFDALSGDPCSVEIITAIDVATRVVLALRVVPRSANGIDAGLLLYDICRPFSLMVEGTSISHWRWVGLPEQLDLSLIDVRVGNRRYYAPDLSTLQGEHGIPCVRPDAIHCDKASIFLSVHFTELLRVLGIDLLLSRGGKPTDNPHVERWHETIQRALQQIPGYKGRNVSERGRLVAEEPLLTARELQEHLRRFVALDYHRSWHTGLILSGEPKARMCPLEMWDAMVEVTGRIDVPQQPDLIYQFLPLRWETISHQGVEIENMVYDAAILDDYRTVARGTFRDADCAASFYVDPHDLSRIWFRDPSSDRVEEIPWKGADRVNAPMTQTITNAARRRIRNRGGNAVLKRGLATQQIIEELGELTATPRSKSWQKRLAAAARRVEQSRIDHDEVEHARDQIYPTVRAPRTPRLTSIRSAWPNLLGQA